MKDTVKYKVKILEYRIHVKNTHQTASHDGSSEGSSVLVMISENIPVSKEEKEIKVEVEAPNMKDAVSEVDIAKWLGNSAHGKDNALDESTGEYLEEDFLNAVIKQEFHSYNQLSTKKGHSKTTLYHSKQSNNLYWAIWLPQHTSTTLKLKYKIIAPFGKHIEIY